MEKLDLDWHTFSDHLFSTSKSFMETKELADVTLISDDQKQLYAHKVFLSAGSEVFRNILINNTHKHPVIYLTNIKHQELEAILQFIYLGKATFYQDKMDDFITAAKYLKVKEIHTGIDLGKPSKKIKSINKVNVLICLDPLPPPPNKEKKN